MGATDLDQALESVPGLHVSMLNIASKPIYSFRGIFTGYNPEVLMLVNGIPITSAFQGDRGMVWGGMPLENVARIEVIRGPGSALYGADAFSGVINIITKTAADIDGTEYGLRAGSFNSRDAWIQHGGKLGKLDAAFYLRAGNTDGQKGIIEQRRAISMGYCLCVRMHHSLPGRSMLNARQSMRAPICPMKHGASGRLISKEKWASAPVLPGAWIPTGAGKRPSCIWI